MSASNPDISLAFVVVAVAAATFATIALRRTIRARNRERRRIVEQPNSHYTSPVVRAGETRHRWQSIDLDSIHEVNRGEVKRLLARVEASGVDSLRENERVFLDQFASVSAPKTAAAPRETGRPLASDLRHRPA
ncbi:MAG TPA: hypothetical protein VHG09_00260 [Longimicrobiales bacterium]|nr:hypothetical protein [Longimicrobiales bacterium]